MSRSPSQVLGSTLYYIVALLLVVVFAGPFLWMLFSSLKPGSEIFANPPTIISPNASLENFPKVFQQAPFARYMFNSFFVATTVTLAALMLHSMAGYALARLHFPGK